MAITAPESVFSSSSPPTPVSSSPPSPAVPTPTKSYPSPSQTGPAPSLLLSQYGLNPAIIECSGPNSIRTKADVLGHIQANSLPTPSTTQVPLPVSHHGQACHPCSHLHHNLGQVQYCLHRHRAVQHEEGDQQVPDCLLVGFSISI